MGERYDIASRDGSLSGVERDSERGREGRPIVSQLVFSASSSVLASAATRCASEIAGKVFSFLPPVGFPARRAEAMEIP